MATDLMRYDKLVEGALRGVMIDALRLAARKGLPGGHYFYVTFRTDYPGVRIDDDLKAGHPEEMRIVLQHQYRGLRIGVSKFEVELSFNKIWRTLVVPFDAVTSFADPSVKFGLQFVPPTDDKTETRLGVPVTAAGRGGGAKDTRSDAEVAAEIASKVVTLDTFRKN